MRKFDYSFLVDGLLPADILNVSMSISELKIQANQRKLHNLKVFTELEDVAKIQSIINSNEIEGIITTDKRIKEIVNGNSAPLNHSEAEIAGYRDALNLIHSNYDSLQIREREILELHRTLLQYTGSDKGGKYKVNDNAIIEIDKQGNRNIRFSPTSAEQTPKAMEQLVLAYMEAKENPNINPLLLIPCFIVDFLCIHPFGDGNGRMSRLLSLLMLYQAGYDAGKYVSFEEQINKNKAVYYEALRVSSIKWHEGENDYFPFIKNFIYTLYMCYKELDKRFAVIKGKKVNKSNRVEATILQSILPITKKEIEAILPDVSGVTIDKVLSKLIKEGRIEKIGTFKDAKYLRV